MERSEWFWFGLAVGVVVMTFFTITLIEIGASDGEFNLVGGRRFVRVSAEQEVDVRFISSDGMFEVCEEMFCEDIKQEDDVDGWWSTGWKDKYECKKVWRRC